MAARQLTGPCSNRRPIRTVARFVATCPACHGRISPDQVMCTTRALSNAAHP